jgi:heptose-I-phosphate ethanolaminephosphotransferase
MKAGCTWRRYWTWSVDAATVPALRNFFYFGQKDESWLHLLALASRAGYAVWWISNHDNLAIDREHAQFADQVQTINKTPVPSSQSMDGGTLPLLKQAINDAAPRKLIVQHLFGAHPHYQLRHPPDRASFRNIKDGVYQDMR